MNLDHVVQDENVIRAEVTKLAAYVDSLQPVFKTCSEAMTSQDVKTCRKEAQDAGLPPLVTILTYK
ncbi:hypothetical protein RSM1_29445 [Methylobacterium radiotolerans]|nr:hypothetical protein RSM1_29445 [Methylobacterium radiotolerans]